MSPEHEKNRYDDGNIPEVDLPKDAGITHAAIPSPFPVNKGDNSAKDRVVTPAEPLPESTRPRKDGPGGA